MSLKRLREIHEAATSGEWFENCADLYFREKNAPAWVACERINLRTKGNCAGIVAAMNSHAALLDLAEAVEDVRDLLLNDGYRDIVNELDAVLKVAEEVE